MWLSFRTRINLSNVAYIQKEGYKLKSCVLDELDHLIFGIWNGHQDRELHRRLKMEMMSMHPT